MRNKIITLLALLSAAFFAQGQVDWSQFDKLMKEGLYKSAYAVAEGVYKQSAASSQRLAAAYHMTQAAAMYQEDVHDSAEARYRQLLPTLEPLEKALCYAFLGEYDSALVYSEVLKATPVERIKNYCEGDKVENMTPTAYDVIVLQMLKNGTLTQQQRVDWRQRLCDFHAADKDDGLRIWHDCQLLESMQSVPNRPMSLQTYKRYLNRYRGSKSPQLASLYLLTARYCRWNKQDLVQVVAYCDTAIALFPKSEGGVECSNLRSQITAPRIQFSREIHFLIPQREELMGITYRNLSCIHLRLVKEPDKYMSEAQLAKLKPLREWIVDVPRHDDYSEALAAFALPSLPIGEYRLLAAPTDNFAKGLAYIELHVTDIALRYTTDGRGLVVDRTTGTPVADQRVQLVSPKVYGRSQERVLQTVVTAADGTYRFDSVPPRNSIIRVVRDGYTISQSVYNHSRSAADGRGTRFHLVSDRPVYRPGDTVQVAVMLYRSDGRDGELLAAGHSFQLTLADPNGQQVQQLTLTTDDFGSAHCALPLPTDRLAGHWTVRVQDSTGSGVLGLRVEEYKQPRFMVSLAAEGTAPQFGQPYTVKGMATAYSGVSLGGARVQYFVSRSQRLWRWGPSVSTVIAQGETEVAVDGTFNVVFTPEPDSSVELSTKPIFNYQVQVTVTDLNGESYDAETTLRVGYRNLFVHVVEMEPASRELSMLKVELTDLDGKPQPGKVEVSVERLKRPDPMRLAPAVLTKGMHQTINREEYHRRFPYYIYDKTENDRRQWPAEWRWDGIADNGDIKLPSLQGGIYRIVAHAMDGRDTVADTAYTLLTLTTDRQARIDAVLWVDQDKRTAHPGERVTFRLGSAFEGVKAFYWIDYGDRKTLASGWLTLGSRLQELTIDIDSSQLGGLTLTVTMMYQGQSFSESRSVEVPYTHKQLKVDISTFRDKLLPGETEEWTIKVKGERSEMKEPAAVILTMYDDALNTYGIPSWGFSPWRGHCTVWQRLYSPYFCWDSYDGSTYRSYYGTSPSVWRLKEGLPYYSPWRSRRMYKAVSNGVVVTELAVVEDDAVVQTSATARGESGEEEVEEEEAIFSVVEKEPEVQVRTNLTTLAFFAPSLHTNADGTVTYRFTVPELLTRWNVRGLAVTKDIKIGTLDRTLVTSKPLMVQPNMPRFLRSGDSLSLMAKVVLNEEIRIKNEELPVEVLFVLTDAATGDTLCCHTEQVRVKHPSAGGSAAAQVMFDVEVPQNVYVATYKIVATAEGMSDGEQGQVPVVTNRQAATVSQAMYINGAGEKRYIMPEWVTDSDSRELHLVAAEVVSNPIWLAVKCMPYLKTHENSSTLYLANQLYMNSKGQELLKDLKDFSVLKGTSSRLKMNEDVKQTLLQATPWVQDAQSEEEQMAAVANYFDAERLNRELQKAGDELAARQNADGGWSWMPEGESSLWITQQVLKKVKGERLKVKEALAFIDREQQRYYEKYIKPYIKKGYKWQPTDIDYLYTRSFYGKANTEAYRFYYSNALKSYKDYENLYTQAQLALVFHRHGDHKQALDLLRRIKEKSLVSDEMGMYWRNNRSGWFWYQRPIQTQALLIQAFAEITPDDCDAIGLMQQWLLKQKQTSHWGNDMATTEAIGALMVNEKLRTKNEEPADAVQLTVFGEPMTAEAQDLEGYRSQRWTSDALDTLITHHSSLITLRKQNEGIAWGAVYYQFVDDLDKLPASDMGIRISRRYEVRSENLKVGDKIKVRIDIQCDRAMEYLELIDGRPACVEPLSTRAGWRWNEGLNYYIVVNNTDTRCYIERLEKGKYWFEYDVYVTNPGQFMSGPVTMQCMYAPEFRAIAPAQTLNVIP